MSGSSVPKSSAPASSAPARSSADARFAVTQRSDSERLLAQGISANVHPTRQYYADVNYEKVPTNLMSRPKFNNSGKPAQISINSHRILEYPNKTVFQYDVR